MKVTGFIFYNDLSDFDLNKYIRFLRLKTYKRVDKKILSYTIFFAIAAVFWLLNKLDNNYNTFIEYPVEYTNLPESKFIVNKLPNNLKLNVNAYGFTLAKYKLTVSPSPIPINLSKFADNINNSESKYTLHTRHIKDIINEEIPSDIVVNDILPDTIQFYFVDIIEKKVAVKPVTQYTLEQQCFINGTIRVTPDSIMVRGPITIIDTLSAIYTETARFKNLSKTEQENIEISKIKNVNFSKQKVTITVPVSKFTQAKLKVPISTVNVPDSLKLVCFPQYTQLTCMVSIDNYKELSAKDFTVTVNYNNIKNLLGNSLSAKVSSYPPNVKQVDIFPIDIEFIIEEK